MDHEQLVRRASERDVRAFVDLTRRFQHFAFGSALAEVRDFQQAEDIVQEAFVAAWAGLPNLAEPAAFVPRDVRQQPHGNERAVRDDQHHRDRAGVLQCFAG